jgi:hypothetical protein
MIEPKPTFELYRPPKFRDVNIARPVAQAIRELLSQQCAYIARTGNSAPIVKFWQEVVEHVNNELREAIRTAPSSPAPPSMDSGTEMVWPKRPKVRRV